MAEPLTPERVRDEIEVYTNPDEPEYGVLVAEASVDEARAAVEREYAGELPIRYLGQRTAPILNEREQPGRRRRFHVFTDEPEDSRRG